REGGGRGEGGVWAGGGGGGDGVGRGHPEGRLRGRDPDRRRRPDGTRPQPLSDAVLAAGGASEADAGGRRRLRPRAVASRGGPAGQALGRGDRLRDPL